ncbi:Sucraseferredoxin-like protein [Ganoderma leucocontextum]|nr:Sucraseferredoxin-like protein [Ganoderma leucocontextum]
MSDSTTAQLQGTAIPMSEAPCRGCSDPCDAGHEELPKLDIDMSPLLGNVKPYGRQIVISTPNHDWAREVTEAEGTLAAYVAAAVSAGGGTSGEQKAPKPALTAASAPGVFDTRADLSQLTRVSIHNGRYLSVSQDGAKETVLVFPDFKAVTEVEVSEEGGREVFEKVLSPSIPLQAAPRPRADSDSGAGIKTWALAYSCVILICSHKKRDNRCWAVAPQLDRALTSALEREGFDVHHQLEDPSLSGPALEDDPTLTSLPSDEEKRAEIRRRLQQHAHSEQRRALVLFCSHVGQHKFAGNVIISMPTGASVWYGRVTPHEVDAIVRETILGGKILPPLLRGGLNLCHPGQMSLNDW